MKSTTQTYFRDCLASSVRCHYGYILYMLWNNIRTPSASECSSPFVAGSLVVRSRRACSNTAISIIINLLAALNCLGLALRWNISLFSLLSVLASSQWWHTRWKVMVNLQNFKVIFSVTMHQVFMVRALWSWIKGLIHCMKVAMVIIHAPLCWCIYVYSRKWPPTRHTKKIW
jgi:hypothetical protein